MVAVNTMCMRVQDVSESCAEANGLNQESVDMYFNEWLNVGV